MTRRHAAVWLAAAAAIAAPRAAAQSVHPLRKSDLIRMLSSAALTKPEIADLVRRNCTSFTPTDRDKSDLRAVGADDALLVTIEDCRRATRTLRIALPDGDVAADAGGEVTVRAQVTRGGAPARGVTLTLSGSGRIAGGRDLQAVTDQSGTATFRVPVGRAIATHDLSLQGPPDERLGGRTTFRVTARPAGVLRAEARPARVDVRPGGGPQLVTVTVQDQIGNAVAGQSVQLAALSGDGGGPQTRTTGLQGEATFTVNPAAFRRATLLDVRVGGRSLDTVEIAFPATASAAHTGWTAGMGQRARVGTLLPQPLVFEVRDTANAPLGDREVTFTVTNAQVRAERTRTDAGGRVAVRVRLGERAGPAAVVARVGGVERQATIVALPGPPARLRLVCGGGEAGARLLLARDTTAVLSVEVTDAFGNGLAPGALAATVGDDAIARVVATTADTGGGLVTLRGRRAGATNLAVTAGGVRAHLVVTVLAPPAAGACRGPAR